MNLKKNKKAKPEVQNWYKDRYQSVVVQRKIMEVVAIGALCITLVLAIIITQLIPLKTISPYVLEVDSKTGVMQVVDPVTAKDLTANEAVNDYFLVQYIRAREGYNAAELLHDVNIVRLMSENSHVYSQFVQTNSPNNPQSPIARLGAFGQRMVKFKSIIYISPQVAQVRVLITEKPDKGASVDLNRIILLGFEYVKMNLTTEERYSNPLGFRVTAYQVTEDVSQ